MGFHIIDVWNGNQTDLPDERAVMAWWRRHCGGRSFEWLSMNGNDTYPHFGWEELEHGGLRRSTAALYTRRYVVYDQEWRIVDIRTWPGSIWEPEPYRHRDWPWNGAKRHRHRSRGPAMRRRMLRWACGDADLPNIPLPRPRTVITDADAWDRAERHYFRSKDNCWKSRAKCGRQWQRHVRAAHGRQ